MLIFAEAVSWGLCCAMVGMVWSVVLAHDDTPMNAVFAWLRTWHKAGGWRSWISSPLGGCVLCFSGQLSLWSLTIMVPWTSAVDVAEHIFAGCSAVLWAVALNSFYEWNKKRMKQGEKACHIHASGD